MQEMLSRWCQVLLELLVFKCTHTHCTHTHKYTLISTWKRVFQCRGRGGGRRVELSGRCHGKGIPSARGGDFLGLGLRSRQMTDRG